MRYFLSVAVLLVLLGGKAEASHYDIADVSLVSDAVVERLLADGIGDTEKLLSRLLTPGDRAAFAQKYGLTASEVHDLARQLEFMQIVGVGPKAARLLILANVESVVALSKLDPAVLLDVLLRVNREHAITGVQPDMIVVRDWIEKSKKISHHLQ